VGFLGRNSTPRSARAQQDVVQVIGRSIWSVIERKDTKQAVSVREFVIEAASREVLVDDLLSRELVKTAIAAG
jgi:hypothetical protein